jgi:hypothetical protein
MQVHWFKGAFYRNKSSFFNMCLRCRRYLRKVAALGLWANGVRSCHQPKLSLFDFRRSCKGVNRVLHCTWTNGTVNCLTISSLSRFHHFTGTKLHITASLEKIKPSHYSLAWNLQGSAVHKSAGVELYYNASQQDNERSTNSSPDLLV